MLAYGDSGRQRPAGSQRCAGFRAAEESTREQGQMEEGAGRGQSARRPTGRLRVPIIPSSHRDVQALSWRGEHSRDHTCFQGVRSLAGTREGGRGQCRFGDAERGCAGESFPQSPVTESPGGTKEDPDPCVTRSLPHQCKHRRDASPPVSAAAKMLFSTTNMPVRTQPGPPDVTSFSSNPGRFSDRTDEANGADKQGPGAPVWVCSPRQRCPPLPVWFPLRLASDRTPSPWSLSCSAPPAAGRLGVSRGVGADAAGTTGPLLRLGLCGGFPHAQV